MPNLVIGFLELLIKEYCAPSWYFPNAGSMVAAASPPAVNDNEFIVTNLSVLSIFFVKPLNMFYNLISLHQKLYCPVQIFTINQKVQLSSNCLQSIRVLSKSM